MALEVGPWGGAGFGTIEYERKFHRGPRVVAGRVVIAVPRFRFYPSPTIRRSPWQRSVRWRVERSNWLMGSTAQLGATTSAVQPTGGFRRGSGRGRLVPARRYGRLRGAANRFRFVETAVCVRCRDGGGVQTRTPSVGRREVAGGPPSDSAALQTFAPQCVRSRTAYCAGAV